VLKEGRGSQKDFMGGENCRKSKSRGHITYEEEKFERRRSRGKSNNDWGGEAVEKGDPTRGRGRGSILTQNQRRADLCPPDL